MRRHKIRVASGPRCRRAVADIVMSLDNVRGRRAANGSVPLLISASRSAFP